MQQSKAKGIFGTAAVLVVGLISFGTINTISKFPSLIL